MYYTEIKRYFRLAGRHDLNGLGCFGALLHWKRGITVKITGKWRYSLFSALLVDCLLAAAALVNWFYILPPIIRSHNTPAQFTVNYPFDLVLGLIIGVDYLLMEGRRQGKWRFSLARFFLIFLPAAIIAYHLLRNSPESTTHPLNAPAIAYFYDSFRTGDLWMDWLSAFMLPACFVKGKAGLFRLKEWVSVLLCSLALFGFYAFTTYIPKFIYFQYFQVKYAALYLIFGLVVGLLFALPVFIAARKTGKLLVNLPRLCLSFLPVFVLGLMPLIFYMTQDGYSDPLKISLNVLIYFTLSNFIWMCPVYAGYALLTSFEREAV